MTAGVIATLLFKNVSHRHLNHQLERIGFTIASLLTRVILYKANLHYVLHAVRSLTILPPSSSSHRLCHSPNEVFNRIFLTRQEPHLSYPIPKSLATVRMNQSSLRIWNGLHHQLSIWTQMSSIPFRAPHTSHYHRL